MTGENAAEFIPAHDCFNRKWCSEVGKRCKAAELIRHEINFLKEHGRSALEYAADETKYPCSKPEAISARTEGQEILNSGSK